MSLTRGQRAALTRAVNRFDIAAQEYAFRGTIPAGESEEASLAYELVEMEYDTARNLLVRLVERVAAK